mmetsp:Transcript_41566/g.115642  ORF Transcript_41566/g.115642 Transcript_41566/m.115642 type:complete len:347 (-) Transcript_41566:498-1538(-)
MEEDLPTVPRGPPPSSGMPPPFEKGPPPGAVPRNVSGFRTWNCNAFGMFTVKFRKGRAGTFGVCIRAASCPVGACALLMPLPSSAAALAFISESSPFLSPSASFVQMPCSSSSLVYCSPSSLLSLRSFSSSTMSTPAAGSLLLSVHNRLYSSDHLVAVPSNPVRTASLSISLSLRSPSPSLSHALKTLRINAFRFAMDSAEAGAGGCFAGPPATSLPPTVAGALPAGVVAGGGAAAPAPAGSALPASASGAAATAPSRPVPAALAAGAEAPLASAAVSFGAAVASGGGGGGLASALAAAGPLPPSATPPAALASGAAPLLPALLTAASLAAMVDALGAICASMLIL